MGNLCSNEIRTEEDDMASRDIERQLKEDEEKFKKISRLLLLGKKESSSFFFFIMKVSTPSSLICTLYMNKYAHSFCTSL